MLFYTHLTFAFLVGIYLIPSQILLVLIGSMIPDIDNANSRVNRGLKITTIFSYLFKHRGFTHSIWFGFGLFILLNSILPQYTFALVLGFASHLVIDSITKKGINFLYPVARFHVSGFIETGKGGEKLILILLIIAIGISFM